MIDLDRMVAESCPVLLTQGDQSPPFFAAIISRLAELIHCVQVTTISDAGHVPHQTHPTEWLVVVTEFARGAG